MLRWDQDDQRMGNVLCGSVWGWWGLELGQFKAQRSGTMMSVRQLFAFLLTVFFVYSAVTRSSFITIRFSAVPSLP